MTKGGKRGINAGYKYKNDNFVNTRVRQNVRVPNPEFRPHKSYMKQGSFFYNLT